MKRQDVTEANRAAWNQAMPKHREGRKVDLKKKFAEPGFSCLDEIETGKLQEIGFAGKRVAQLGCNNGREILSVVNLGAAEGVGFDISDEAINDATELAGIAGVNCRFVRTDVYEIGPEWHNQFDIVYITIGALSWLPDLDRFFEIVAAILKPGGSLFVYEQHPFLYMIATEEDPEYDPDHPRNVCFSYFRREPWKDETGIDYIGGTQYQSSPSYSYTQTLSAIINPILGHGLMLKEFNEHPHDISEVWAHAQQDDLMPMCYTLIATKGR